MVLRCFVFSSFFLDFFTFGLKNSSIYPPVLTVRYVFCRIVAFVSHVAIGDEAMLAIYRSRTSALPQPLISITRELFVVTKYLVLVTKHD